MNYISGFPLHCFENAINGLPCSIPVLQTLQKYFMLLSVQLCTSLKHWKAVSFTEIYWDVYSRRYRCASIDLMVIASSHCFKKCKFIFVISYITLALILEHVFCMKLPSYRRIQVLCRWNAIAVSSLVFQTTINNKKILELFIGFWCVVSKNRENNKLQ